MNNPQLTKVIQIGATSVSGASNAAELYDAVSLLVHSLSLQLSTLKTAKSDYNRRANTRPRPIAVPSFDAEMDSVEIGGLIEEIRL